MLTRPRPIPLALGRVATRREPNEVGNAARPATPAQAKRQRPAAHGHRARVNSRLSLHSRAAPSSPERERSAFRDRPFGYRLRPVGRPRGAVRLSLQPARPAGRYYPCRIPQTCGPAIFRHGVKRAGRGQRNHARLGRFSRHVTGRPLPRLPPPTRRSSPVRRAARQPGPPARPHEPAEPPRCWR